MLYPAGTHINGAYLRECCDAAFGSGLAVTEVPIVPPSSGAWLVSSPDRSQLLMVTTRTLGIKKAGMHPSIGESLGKPVLRVTIELLDDSPRDRQRVFTLAAELSKREAFAFSAVEMALIWRGPQLSQKLRWQDRVPYAKDISKGYFLEIDETTRLDSTYSSWNDRMRATSASRGLPVVLLCRTGYCDEAIPATLLRADLERETFVVRPAADSVLDPLVKANREYNCEYYVLRLPEPN